jgi:hypothetical protein
MLLRSLTFADSVSQRINVLKKIAAVLYSRDRSDDNEVIIQQLNDAYLDSVYFEANMKHVIDNLEEYANFPDRPTLVRFLTQVDVLEALLIAKIQQAFRQIDFSVYVVGEIKK